MKNVLLWIWQFPQNIIGLFLSLFSKKKKQYICNDGEKVTVYFMKFFDAGVSLGNYIIIDTVWSNEELQSTINHEHGHQKQSRFLGWFYLPIVGLPSVSRNIYDRLAHKGKPSSWRVKWYYSRFPENQADKLGGVERDFI